eukprot:CFRG4041T1
MVKSKHGFKWSKYPNESDPRLYQEVERKSLDIHTGNQKRDEKIDKLLAINTTGAAYEAFKSRIYGKPIRAVEIQSPEFACNAFSDGEECTFNNICVYNITKPSAKWFTFQDMGYSTSGKFNLKRLGRKVFEMDIDVFHPAKNRFVELHSGSLVHYIDENVHIFNVQYGHRYYIYLRGTKFSKYIEEITMRTFYYVINMTLILINMHSMITLCLLKSIEERSKKTPYHLLYMTHFGNGVEMKNLHYFENKHKVVYEKFTYDHRPLGTFPAALEGIEEPVVCFKQIHLQYDSNVTGMLQGTEFMERRIENRKLMHGKNPYERFNLDIMLKMIPRFQKHLHKSYNVLGLPMIKNRCLLITRRQGRNENAIFRKILNEDKVVELLENFGLEVDMVDFATISDYEQIIRTRQAEVFVGMHGAGMANSIWLHKEAIVIELQTYGFQKWGYRNLMRVMGIMYFHWINTHPENTVHNYRSLENEGGYDFYR